MADQLERSAPASRQISPITQPPSPDKTKEEEAEEKVHMAINRDAEAGRSTSVSIKEEDTESKAALHLIPSASASLHPTEATRLPTQARLPTEETRLPSEETSLEGADTTGDVDTANTQPTAALHLGRSASASPLPAEETRLEGADTAGDVDTAEDVDTSGDVDAADIQSKCVMSFLRPQPGKCSSKITNDDRHYISNFFGRNKTCSTNIPDDFYQVLCRKCMQSMKYRLKCNKDEKEIHSQVAAIKHVLQNMAASGKWVLLEVQLTKAEYDRRLDPAKYDKEIKEFNDAVIKAREDAKQKGEVVRRRNTKPALIPVPDWLASLVVRSDDDAGQDYTPVHEREPTRWTFEDLIGLVDLIGENCDVLPNIECLPVTQGELDQVRVREARAICNVAKEDCQETTATIAQTEADLRRNPTNQQLQQDLQDFKKMLAEMEGQLEDAEEELKRAVEDAATTFHTMPPKRHHENKPGKKGESSKRVDKVASKKKAATTAATTTPSPDPASTMASPHDDNMATVPDYSPPASPQPAASPSPPPGWKGKARASPPAPSTPPPPASSGSASSPRTSTTRSAGRRIGRVAGKRGREEEVGEEGEEVVAVTEEGSPVRKKGRRE